MVTLSSHSRGVEVESAVKRIADVGGMTARQIVTQYPEMRPKIEAAARFGVDTPYPKGTTLDLDQLAIALPTVSKDVVSALLARASQPANVTHAQLAARVFKGEGTVSVAGLTMDQVVARFGVDTQKLTSAVRHPLDEGRFPDGARINVASLLPDA
jgi:hypothetical protein